MLSYVQLKAQLDQMEAALAETRRTLFVVQRKLESRAETESIRRRPKSRYYHRRMSRWTGADEAEYRRVLDDMMATTGPELERLRRRAERQDAAIETLRSKYHVNAERPAIAVW